MTRLANYDPPYFCEAQMGRGTAREASGGGVVALTLYPSVSPAGCHLPIWLRKMGRICA